MRNGSAAVLEPDQAHTYNPERDFTAQYVNTQAGLTSGRLTVDQTTAISETRLSRTADGVFVIVRGTIDVVRVFENSKPYMPPSAMFRLESGTGAATYVHVGHREYERIWGFLVYGRVVSVSGKVVRPERGAPEYINLSRLLIASADVLTPQTYAAQLAESVPAVNV